MDPNTTWQLLCATVTVLSAHPEDRTVRAEAVALLEALAQWLRRGGFPPISPLVDPAKEDA
jgi:hypothetical protein